MRLTEQGYFNAVVHVSEPGELYELFEPTVPGEETGRLEDVETALTFINDMLDADRFNTPTNEEWNVEELLMKGYVLERIRFRILREEWEPIFQPFPDDPLQYYDPDVTFVSPGTGNSRFTSWVKLRTVPGEYATSSDPATIYIHESVETEELDYDYWIKSLGIEVTGDDLEEVLTEYLQEAKVKFGPDIQEELEEKLAKVLKNFYREFPEERE